MKHSILLRVVSLGTAIFFVGACAGSNDTAKAKPAAKAKAGRTTDTRRVMLRMEPARGPGGFAAKVALKSREKAEEQRRARLWDSLDDGVPEREPEVYPW